MPRVLGAIEALAAAEVYWEVKLVEIDNGGTPLRYTNWHTAITQTIEASSRTFTPAVFTIDGLGQNQERGLLDASVEIANANNAMSAIVLSAAGTRNKRIQVWEGWYNPTTLAWVDYIKLLDGRMDAADMDRQSARIGIIPHNKPWVLRTPGLPYLPTCVLKFKGALCQYAGADTTCDRTFEACTLKANATHFMGFRYLPDPSKPIWWLNLGTDLPQSRD